MKVVRLHETGSARRDPAVACGSAMRTARGRAGLDLDQAARRVNLALGTAVVTAGLLECWERGVEGPPAVVLVEAVRLAGEQAAAIFAGLA